MSGEYLNHRQAILLIRLGFSLAGLIDVCHFNAHKPEDRVEIMDVLEELHNQLYESHVEMLTRGEPIGPGQEI